MGKNVLVTGGAGFVGSHLVEYLISLGHHVTVVDNLYTGSLKNLELFVEHQRFSYISHDIRLPLEGDFEEIYHLACPASPKHYQSDPRGTITTCFLGTLNVLELAERNSAKIFIASTSEVYGDPLEHPQNECYNGNVKTMGPRACYDEGKRSAETLCYVFRETVDIRIGRIFNTYGPRMCQNDGRVISEFMVAALKSEDLCIYGDGKQTRSFQYIDDLVRGIAMMMEHEKTHKEDVLLCNLGNPDEKSILEVALMVKNLTGSKSAIKMVDAAIDDPTRRRPDISKAMSLGWQPIIPLTDGLEKTAEYFKYLILDN